jgi:hypothetical protein
MCGTSFSLPLLELSAASEGGPWLAVDEPAPSCSGRSDDAGAGGLGSRETDVLSVLGAASGGFSFFVGARGASETGGRSRRGLDGPACGWTMGTFRVFFLPLFLFFSLSAASTVDEGPALFARFKCGSSAPSPSVSSERARFGATRSAMGEPLRTRGSTGASDADMYDRDVLVVEVKRRVSAT